MKEKNLVKPTFPKVKFRLLVSILSKSVFVLFLLFSLLGTNATSASATADPAPKACFTLTLGFTGTGSKPVATPDRSTGCLKGKYKAGQKITLTAQPASGWEVSSWTGTDNNSSTSTTNTVTMPNKNQKVAANYVLACYALTRTHTGNGLDPTATPTNSSGCTVGEYHLGESVSLNASPATSWEVLNWSGTANNASTSTVNSITIPNGDRTVTVNYHQVCFDLTLLHTGNGSDPVPSPASSVGCPSGQYRSAQLITLSATPDSGWDVGSWVGADDNLSVDATNQLTMPNGTHTVTVNYAEEVIGCYHLAPLSIGYANYPTPSPLNSGACGLDYYYVEGEVVTFSTTVPAGYVIRGWKGTANDSLTSPTNSWTMTADNHVVLVDYAPILTSNFLSVGKYDGWVLESTETSTKGGTRNPGASTINVGDDDANRQYRGILSFDTTGLPDTARILSVTLQVRKQGIVGTNPFKTHGRLRVDIRKPYFGTSIGLQLSDFQTKPNQASVAVFGKPSSTGWYSASLAPISFTNINVLGSTQFRLRFAKDDNNDSSADYVKLFSGNGKTSNRPVLIVKYYIP